MNKGQVIKKIGAERWKEFQKFMKGQTVGLSPEGTEDYCLQDVDNFLRKPKDRFFD